MSIILIILFFLFSPNFLIIKVKFILFSISKILLINFLRKNNNSFNPIKRIVKLYGNKLDFFLIDYITI